MASFAAVPGVIRNLNEICWLDKVGGLSATVFKYLAFESAVVD